MNDMAAGASLRKRGVIPHPLFGSPSYTFRHYTYLASHFSL